MRNKIPAVDAALYNDLCSDKKVSLVVSAKNTKFPDLISYLDQFHKEKGLHLFFADNKWTLEDQKLAILLLISFEQNLFKSVSHKHLSLKSYFEIDQERLSDGEKMIIAQIVALFKQCGYLCNTRYNFIEME